MASAADDTKFVKADPAAEKAFAEAVGSQPGKAAAIEAPEPAPSKIAAAVAEIKATPPKKAPARKATKPAAKKSALRKSASKSAIAQTRVARTQAAKPALDETTTVKTTAPRIAAVAQMKDKIMATVNETTTDYTAKAKDLASDAQTKAKAAYDKMQAVAGEMTEFTKGNVEAMVESGKILGTGMQDMVRGEVEAAKGAFETATADVKAMAAVKSPTELFKLQGEMLRRNFDAMVAHYSKNAETSMKLANDAFAPISSRMSLAAEKISKAA
ncbi:TIGR01841 family phasin [Tsuneonella amylolytica]|uniref:TIGR01841 family phasin n=1 Tax=Tsuneonella amylolytica TaxID=2338327 RepID=UPI000EAA38F7|nr:TIGR01841 family phasin [Tsuneonella amylolytica]